MKLTTGLKLIWITWAATTHASSQCDDSHPGQCGEVSVCKNFITRGGDLSSATRVLLASFHGRESEVAACVDTLTKNVGQHVVLVEGAANQVIDCNEFLVTKRKNRTCKGWDDMAAYSKVHSPEVTKAQVYQMIKQEYQKQKISDENFDRNVSAMKMETSSVKYSAMFKVLKTEIEGLRKKGKTYVQIFKKLDNEIIYSAENDTPAKRAEYAAAIKARNKAMVNALVQNSGVFTVVTAGAVHLIDVWGHNGIADHEVSDAARYVRGELKKDKHQNPYAILAMDPQTDPRTQQFRIR